MEKWRARGKACKAESVLPPTRRPSGVAACLPVENSKKKERKWSFGGLFRRISSAQYQDASSNDEDITYIPGHMLSKSGTKKTSKMKSKLGRMERKSEPEESVKSEGASTASRDTAELLTSLGSTMDKSQDSVCPCNDSVNSGSSEGSLDVPGKGSRMSRTKVRAQAKRERLCGHSSSDEDSRRSNQSLGVVRSEDNIHNGAGGALGSQRSEACSRKSRAARTERYIKRMFREEGPGGSDSRITRPAAVPRFNNPNSHLRYSSNSVDSGISRTRDATSSFGHAGSSPSVLPQGNLARENRHVDSRGGFDRPRGGCLRDMNENETFEREKRTWPPSHDRSANLNGIYGSLRQPKPLPPEPPPRSSKSRVIANAYSNAPYVFNSVNPGVQSPQLYPISPYGTRRTYNSDNEVLLSDHVAPVRLRHLWQNQEHAEPSQNNPAEPDPWLNSGNGYCNSLDRTRTPSNYTAPPRKNRVYHHDDQENHDPRPYFQATVAPPSYFTARSTSSLPKGVQLFSRQRLSHCEDSPLTSSHSGNPLENRDHLEDPVVVPRLKKNREFHDYQGSSAPRSTVGPEDDEAERKRSSKNLEDALTELEAIYNSLRLSDEDLLERAEQRSMQEYRDKAAAKRTSFENFNNLQESPGNRRREMLARNRGFSSHLQEDDPRMKDDMAYRRMNPKDRPSSVNGQASLSQISYLATSPNLSLREDERPPRRTAGRTTPDLTRDDLLFRSISHANNTLRVIDPQPPFGIPLGPVATATDSDYLHIKPAKPGQTRSLYIPQSEPDVVSDDLAFRNLRKESSTHKNNVNLFVQTDAILESSPGAPCGKNSLAVLGTTKKKRAVRSMSADLYGIVSKEKSRPNGDWYNDYIQSTQKLRLFGDSERELGLEEGNERACGFRENVQARDEDFFDAYRGAVEHGGLDINGNRPKSALQGKIQVYVPQEEAPERRASSCERMKLRREVPANSGRGIFADESSEESVQDRHVDSPSEGRCVFKNDERTNTIESFTEQELSEYKQLCQDLEKLIQRTEEVEEKKLVEEKEESEDYSQSEVENEFEKLLEMEDYEDVSREDDRSSSRSLVLGGESVSSDNLQASPKKQSTIPEDEESSASELGIGSSNTGSLTDSVYDKFNQLLREVNEVPYVQPGRLTREYPTEESLEEKRERNSEEEGGPKIENSSSESTSKEEDPGVEEQVGFELEEDTQGITANAYRDRLETKTEAAIRRNLKKDEEEQELLESPRRRLRGRRGELGNEEDDDTRTRANRQGEIVEDLSGCNGGFDAFKETSKRITAVSDICHVTNRVTAYHVVLCSLLLTLLVILVVAR